MGEPFIETEMLPSRMSIREGNAKAGYYGPYASGPVSEHTYSQSNTTIEAMNPMAWRWAKNNWHGACNVYMEGPTGTGKTFLAHCMLCHAYVNLRTVADVSVRRMLKTSMLFNEGEDWHVWNSVDVLLLDDIDKAMWDARRIEALWELLDTRCAAKLSTIVTANVAFENLGKLLRDFAGNETNASIVTATLDRLKPLKVLKMLGESQRQTEMPT